MLLIEISLKNVLEVSDTLINRQVLNEVVHFIIIIIIVEGL